MKIDADEIRRKFEIARDSFIKELKEQRKRLRMGTRELAKVFGVDSSTVWRWENKISIPYCGMAIALEVVEAMEPRTTGSTFGHGNRPPRYSKEESERFIEMFKKQRESLGFTFRKVAEILNVSITAPHHWEHGKVHPTKLTWEYILETLAKHKSEPNGK